MINELHESVEPNIFSDLPKPHSLFRSVRSLKQLLDETRAIEVEFFERVYELETEFQKKHQLVYQKRYEIINGDYVPTEADGVISEKSESPSNDKKDCTNEKKLLEASAVVPKSGVPFFWLNVLTTTIAEIHENDRPILEHLTDIREQNKPLSELGFILEFHFSPNEYFENAVLRKEYFYTSSDNKMVHEIPLIRKSVGSEIKWKDGKAPTYPSWFDFLESSKAITSAEEEFVSCITGIQKDFEMGYFIKEHVIPRAVLYFTGEDQNLFNVYNYNSEYRSSMSSLSSASSESDDSTSSELEFGCNSEAQRIRKDDEF